MEEKTSLSSKKRKSKARKSNASAESVGASASVASPESVGVSATASSRMPDEEKHEQEDDNDDNGDRLLSACTTDAPQARGTLPVAPWQIMVSPPAEQLNATMQPSGCASNMLTAPSYGQSVTAAQSADQKVIIAASTDPNVGEPQLKILDPTASAGTTSERRMTVDRSQLLQRKTQLLGLRETASGDQISEQGKKLIGYGFLAFFAVLAFIILVVKGGDRMAKFNVPLFTAFLGPVFAQLCKPFTHLAEHQLWAPSRALGSGGMPSGHSAFVMGLTVSIGIRSGWDCNEFAIAFTVAVVVLYDACHVRLESEHHAQILNELVMNFPSGHPVRALARNCGSATGLKEKVGHYKSELVGGCTVGVLCALLVDAIVD